MAVKEGWLGRFFEDFEIGDVFRSHIGRTITQADNIWLTLLTNNTNQIHFNEHYASFTEFGKPLVNSAISQINPAMAATMKSHLTTKPRPTKTATTSARMTRSAMLMGSFLR